MLVLDPKYGDATELFDELYSKASRYDNDAYHTGVDNYDTVEEVAQKIPHSLLLTKNVEFEASLLLLHDESSNPVLSDTIAQPEAPATELE